MEKQLEKTLSAIFQHNITLFLMKTKKNLHWYALTKIRQGPVLLINLGLWAYSLVAGKLTPKTLQYIIKALYHFIFQ